MVLRNKAEACRQVREELQTSMQVAAKVTLPVKKYAPQATLPTKQFVGDLGYDLYSAYAYTIYPGEQKLVDTAIGVSFPPAIGGLIRDRSGVATKKKLMVVAGVIDNQYTGTIMIAMWNMGGDIVEIAEGEKIAQMILIPVLPQMHIVEVEELVETERGDKGFGSSGS